MNSWFTFLKESYVRCGFVVAFIVMQWLIIQQFENASSIFVFTMSLVAILATKIIYDKDSEIEALKDQLDSK